MDPRLVAASLLLFALGLIHSVLGELLILRHLERVQGLPRILGGVLGGEDFTRRTLRAVWHVPTLLAWAFARLLGNLAYAGPLGANDALLVGTLSIALLLCGILVLAITRGRHAGGVVFLVIAALCWLVVR